MSSQAVRRTESSNLTAALDSSDLIEAFADLDKFYKDADMTAEATLKQLKLTANENECVMDTLNLHETQDQLLLQATEKYFLFVAMTTKNVNWSLDFKGVPKAESSFDYTNTFSDQLFKDYEESCFSLGGMMCYFNIFLKGEISIYALTNLGANWNFTALPACTSTTCTGVDVSSLTDVGLPQAIADKLDLSLDNLDFHVDVDKCDY